MEVNDLPNNSRAAKKSGRPKVPTRDKREEQPKRTSDPVRTTKQSSAKPKVRRDGFIQRTAKTFLGGDPDSVISYIVWDVLVPAAKETVQDIITQGIDMLLFPNSSDRRSTKKKNYGYGRGSRVSYGSFYKDDQRSSRGTSGSREEGIRGRSKAKSPRKRLGAVVFETKEEAKEVLGILGEIVDQYEYVTVADFYDVSGLQNHAQSADNSWGWDTLQYTAINKTRDGYEIDFSRPERVEK